MIQRMAISGIGVALGVFVTFAVFGVIIGALDSLYLETRDTCSHGDFYDGPAGSERFLRVAAYTDNGTSPVTRQTAPSDVDWTYAYNVSRGGAQECRIALGTHQVAAPGSSYLLITPTGDFIDLSAVIGPSSGDWDVPPRDTRPNMFWRWSGNAVGPAQEGLFISNRELIELLAVIAAIGMPLGAMTAVVFFGQAVVAAGVADSGASQALAAIAAVVIIMLTLQLFQQYSDYLGSAFHAVDGDRFVVFRHSLGRVAETVAEFWGVLAFASMMNVAAIVWRHYGGGRAELGEAATGGSVGGRRGGL